MQGYDAVAAVYSLSVEHIVARYRTHLEGRVAPFVREFALADGCRFGLVVGRVHGQVQRHDAVAAVDRLSVEDVITRCRFCQESGISPSKWKFFLADSNILVLAVGRVHRQVQGHYAVAAIGVHESVRQVVAGFGDVGVLVPAVETSILLKISKL